MPGSRLVLGWSALNGHPGDRDCACSEPTLLATSPDFVDESFVSGYTIRLPESDTRRRDQRGTPEHPIVRVVRLCRRCAVELAVAILEHEVAP